MKPKLILTTAIVGVALVVPSASSAAPLPTQDSVVLTGGPAFTEFSSLPSYRIDEINATSGPSGENPTGRVAFLFFIRGPGTYIDGPVTCLAVRGNTATINVEDQTTLVGTIATVQVVDDQPDTFGAAALGRAPTDCSPAQFGGGMQQALTNGDIAVVDAQPPPTNKDQCKNGGWKQLGFANQGQCVAFVNHHH